MEAVNGEGGGEGSISSLHNDHQNDEALYFLHLCSLLE